MWVGSAALVDFVEDRSGVLLVKHRQSPHLPVCIARMGIVGELDIERPIVVQTVVHLHAYLVVGQRRQKGKRSLCQVKSHDGHSFSVPLITWGRCCIGHVGGSVVEAYVLPGFERGAQRAAPLRRLLQNLRPLVEVVAPLVARLDHGFYGDAACRRAGGETLWMAESAAAELEHYILTEVVQQLMHLPGMNSTRGDGHNHGQGCPVLLEE